VIQEYFCHNCWRHNPLENLRYRSLESADDEEVAHWARNPGSRGLRSVKELLGSPVRRAWQKLFGDADPTALQSRSQARIVLYCPECSVPLSDRNILDRSHAAFLGIFGPRFSGKTLFMISLIQELNHKQVDGRTLGLVGLGDSNVRMGALADQLRRGMRPKPNLPERRNPGKVAQQASKAQRFTWQLQLAGLDRRRVSSALLSLYDVSGEDLAIPQHESLPVLDNYCRSMTSLIFLIDGKGVARDLGLPARDAWDSNRDSGSKAADEVNALKNVQDRIGQEHSKQEVDLALVLSKADHLWEQPGWQKLNPENGQIESEAFERVMRDLLSKTDRNPLMAEAAGFRRVKLFSASSLGFLPKPKDVDKKSGQLKDAGRINPQGVIDAATWLLSLRLPTMRRSS
jgi:hypothetical protein